MTIAEYFILHPGQFVAAWLAIGSATYCIFMFVFKFQVKSTNFVANCVLAWPVAWAICIISAIQAAITVSAKRMLAKYRESK